MQRIFLSRTTLLWIGAFCIGWMHGCQSGSTTGESGSADKAVGTNEAVVERPEGGEAEQAKIGAPTVPPPAEDDSDMDEDDLVLFAEGLPQEEGPAPLTVRFTVESLLVGEMEGAQYTWDFGDGSPTSADAGPTHTYEKPGEYTVTIRIVDGEGQRGWDEIEIEVDAPEPH